MDFFKEAQKLTDAAKAIAEEGARNLNDAAIKAQATAAEAITASMATVDQFNCQSVQWAEQATEAIKQTLNHTNQQVSEFTASSLIVANNFQEKTAIAAQQGFETIQQTTSNITATTTGLGAAGMEIANALKDLPRTAEELAREMPKIAYRLRNRAGLRIGDAPRSDADVMQLFDKIPGTSKLGANETKIRQFLSDKHGSHVVSRHQGGSNGADNILWEVGSANIQRGAKVMTGGEQIYIRFYNAIDSILRNSATITRLGLTATGTAVITQAVITAVAYSLDLYRGDITVEEFRDRIFEAAIAAGIAAPIFFLILIAALALFPELAILFSAPAVIAGFNALFGISIAVPIIQSIVRHIEGGGFGQEAAQGYQGLLDETQKLLETSTTQIANLGEELSTKVQEFLPASGEM